jgi:uncharacterized coiled-coil DUF342 family protein
MSAPKPSLLDVQVNRANRRLFLQAFVNRLMGCLTAALAVALVWFLVEPFVIEPPIAWLKWVVAGGLLGVGVIVSLVFAWLRAPSKLAAALSIDERFDLKERVTTSLALTPDQQATPAGQALLEDVHQRIASIDVPSRFPIRLSWLASAVPLAAALLILTSLFYDPPRVPADAKRPDSLKAAPTNPAEISQTMEKLKKKVLDLQQPEEAKSEKLKEIEAEMDRIANRPRDTKEQVRERVREMAALEEKIRDQQKDLADKAKTMKQQLQELNRQAGQDSKDGPANDLQKALADGDLNKAKDEMDKLAKKLEEDKLSKEDKQKLEKQLEKLQNKAEQMAKEQKEREQNLEKLIKEAKAEGRDAEALQRELDQLKQAGKGLDKLQEMAQQLQQCKNCMAKGDMKGAAGSLKKAQEQLKEMNLSEQEMKDLQSQLDKLQEAKEACCKGCKGGNKAGNGDKGDNGLQGEQQAKGGGGEGGQEQGDPGDGLGQGDKGVGSRPKGKNIDGKSFDARQKADFDAGKKMYLDGFAPGQNYKAKSGPEIAGEIKQASQEAPEAIEQQRIPKAKRDIAKDYYRNLGGQAERDKK